MGKRKIIWSQRANRKLFEILDFYAKRNKSATYSTKLYKKFNKELLLLINQPEIGIVTDFNNIRSKQTNRQIKILESKDTFAVKNLYFYRKTCGSNYVHTRKGKLDKLCLG